MRDLGIGFWLKLAAVGIATALGVFAIPILYSDQQWLLLAFLLISLVAMNVAYWTNWVIPLRYLIPGLVFTVLFYVWPIIFTFYVATSNWATGHILTKDQALESLLSQTELTPDAPTLDLYVYQNTEDETQFRFLVITPDDQRFFGTPRPQADPRPENPEDWGLQNLADVPTTDPNGDGIPDTVEGTFRLLDPLRDISKLPLYDTLVLDTPLGEARVNTSRTASLATVKYTFDAAANALVIRSSGERCPADTAIGNFICPTLGTLDPGWRVYVGLENFRRAATDTRVRGPLVRVFIWTVVFAASTVATSLALGLLLALAFNDPRMRGRSVYRSFMIVPYVVPAFLTVLIWRGLLNREFGPINELLGTAIPWLENGTWAKVSIILVNLWLTFPYMFLITSGALQAIPGELLEAAKVDGASGPKVFRRITFPLLMISIGPLLIGSFAYAFNNFILIFLLTQGGPPLSGFDVPVGQTDILISFTYKLAFQSGRGSQFALAAAFTILIFFIVALISAFSFRYTRRLERIYGNV